MGAFTIGRAGDTEMVSLQDAARLMGVNPKTVRRLIDTGELRAVRIRRVWRILPSDIENYLSARSVNND